MDCFIHQLHINTGTVYLVISYIYFLGHLFFFEHFVNILSFYIAVIINRMLLREQLTNYISPGDQLGFSDSSNKGDCHFFPVPFETTRCHCRTIGVGLLLRQTP